MEERKKKQREKIALNTLHTTLKEKVISMAHEIPYYGIVFKIIKYITTFLKHSKYS